MIVEGIPGRVEDLMTRDPMVIDQNALASGSSPFLKCATYRFAPLYFFRTSGPSEVGYTASCGRLAPRPYHVISARLR